MEQAIEQVRDRVKKGGHDVPLDRIVSTHRRARENFNSLAALADKSEIV
jgi:predicted ABC-type ATPase